MTVLEFTSVLCSFISNWSSVHSKNNSSVYLNFMQGNWVTDIDGNTVIPHLIVERLLRFGVSESSSVTPISQDILTLFLMLPQIQNVSIHDQETVIWAEMYPSVMHRIVHM